MSRIAICGNSRSRSPEEREGPARGSQHGGFAQADDGPIVLFDDLWQIHFIIESFIFKCQNSPDTDAKSSDIELFIFP